MHISSSSEAHAVRASRDIARVVRTPPPAPGFIGEGHHAVEVLQGVPLASADPFVLLMDDRLDMPVRRVIGGAHPHAGLETVTLLLDGSVYDPDEGELSAGEAVWMTAGRGVVHSEHVEAEGQVRILQLWIGLPERSRFAPPALQVIRGDAVKTQREPGVMLRLYSGSLGPLRSTTRNLVPVTLAELALEPDAQFELAIPARLGGFVYAVAGEFTAGRSRTKVANGDVAWLDAPLAEEGALSLKAGASGARLVLYAGEPQRERLIQHGPFVADTEASIARFFREYRAGRFPRLSELARSPEKLGNTTSPEH